tara:strand:+ start:213 stop:488 length:276 start_codon:yes stop_codon:yes gene_type:complete
MDKSKHTEYEIQQLREYGYIKYPFKKQNKMKEKVEKVKKLLAKKGVEADDVSPNFVNQFANKNGITDLTSQEVVKISDTYASKKYHNQINE